MNWHDDKILIVLSVFLVFFSLVTLFIIFMRPDDGQSFTLFGGATSALIGALLGWVRPPEKLPPPGSTTTTSVSQQQTTETPKETPGA
jgi:hypothetical protein